ncbi:GSCOCG00005771001-RA-CDS [Cotesia congregata]|nr:GSCOCG00005771001-RA-CDS [Cotesia congregata]
MLIYIFLFIRVYLKFYILLKIKMGKGCKSNKFLTLIKKESLVENNDKVTESLLLTSEKNDNNNLPSSSVEELSGRNKVVEILEDEKKNSRTASFYENTFKDNNQLNINVSEPDEPAELEEEISKVNKKSLTREEYYTKLAELHIKYNCIPQAIRYYTLAIGRNPTKESLYNARAKLQYDSGNSRAFILAYQEFSSKLDAEDQHQLVVINCAKKLAQLLIKEKNYTEALKPIESIFQHCLHLLSDQEVNLYLFISLKLRKFYKCIDILSKHTSIQIEYKVIDSKIFTHKLLTSAIEFCHIPKETPVNLKINCIILFIELGCIDKVDCYLDEFDLKNIKIYSNLIVDLIKSLMNIQRYDRARRLLELLMKWNKVKNLVSLWMLYAECCVECFAKVENFELNISEFLQNSETDPIIPLIQSAIVDKMAVETKWMRLARIYQEFGYEDQMATCRTKAAGVDLKNNKPEVENGLDCLDILKN